MKANRKRARPGELRVVWGASERGDEPSLIYLYNGSRSDALILGDGIEGPRYQITFDGLKHGLMSCEPSLSLAQELEAAGYDLSTLEIRISKKKDEVKLSPVE